MVKCLGLVILCAILSCGLAEETKSATELATEIYSGCLQHVSFSCVRPKALAWISAVQNNDVIHITDDLAIRRTGQILPEEQQPRSTDSRFEIFDKIEDFLSTHELQVKVPAPLRPDGALGSFVPRALSPDDISVPFTGRSRSSLMRKVIIPFLLGLKFKTGVLVPLGLALIALKTWKALTLGLLSLVLSGAMLIFKFTKPKIINYEVIHYPHHHVDHHIDHPPPAAWEHPGYGRALNPEPEQLAYRGHL